MSPAALKSGQAAGSPLTSCPYANSGKKLETFCNLDEIALTLTAGQRSVSVKNSRATAADLQSPPATAHPGIVSLLGSYSTVIDLLAPHDAGGAKGATPIDGIVVFAKSTAGEHCGKHPSFHMTAVEGEAAEAERKGFLSPQGKMSLPKLEYELKEFIQMVIGRKDWRSLVSPVSVSRTFTAHSCAAPSNHGTPLRGQLTGFARLRSLDTWSLAYQRIEGFAIKLGSTGSMTFTKGKTVQKDTTTYSRLDREGHTQSTSSTESIGLKGDKIFEQTSDKAVTTSPSGASTTMTQQTMAADLRAFDDEESRTKAVKALNRQEPDEKKFAAAKAQWNRLTLAGARTVQVTRNGVDIGAKLQEGIESVSNGLTAACEMLETIAYAWRNGAKAAFPVSFTAGLSSDLTFMAGKLSFTWNQRAGKPLQGPAYYVDTSKAEWHLNLATTIVSGSLTAEVSGEAKFLASWVASASLIIRAKLTGSLKLNHDFRYPGPAESFQEQGDVGASLSVIGEVVAATYYWKAQATAEGGLGFLWDIRFDGEAFQHFVTNVCSKKSTGFIWLSRGNKLAEWFGLGEENVTSSWPEDGPFAILTEDQYKWTFG